jgi:thiosulfate reductase cytochrome b subunit
VSGGQLCNTDDDEKHLCSGAKVILATSLAYTSPLTLSNTRRTHVVTGLSGLGLLGVQAVLPALFGGNSDLRTVHAFLGTGILGLFAVHAALGIQLGLSI